MRAVPGAPPDPRGDFGQGMADLASILGSYSTGEMENRIGRGNQTQSFDQLMLQAEQGQRGAETDALRKLAVTGYLGSGGQPYSPATIPFMGGSRQLPSYGFGPRGTSAAQQQAAGDLESTLLARLKPGGTYMPTPLSEYADRGLGEKIGNIGGLVVGGLGAVDTVFGGIGSGSTGVGESISNLAGKIPGLGSVGSALGKALPFVGAGAGIAGLMKDRGAMSNIASGAGAGASIGSIVPGLGTAVGAGIGGLVGALRGLGGGPSETELAGRSAAGSARQMLASRATPQQMQEAQTAGWANPGDALALIVLRDRLGSDAAAQQVMSQLYQAEQQGPEAVNAILSRVRL